MYNLEACQYGKADREAALFDGPAGRRFHAPASQGRSRGALSPSPAVGYNRGMSLKALIFDFDGLILDTETPELQAWQEIYAEYGLEFPVASWGRIVGGTGAGHFDPLDHLEALVDGAVDRAALQARHLQRDYALIAANSAMPGVDACLETARQAGLKRGIASSSPSEWVSGHLTRIQLQHAFDVIVTADDVARTKPDPSLFLTACQRLGVSASEAIVFEDSPNGILAANRAGIFCVAVPNPVTRQLALGSPDLVLDSLEDFRLEKLPDRFL